MGFDAKENCPRVLQPGETQPAQLHILAGIANFMSFASLDTKLPRKRIVKALIRLRRCEE